MVNLTDSKGNSYKNEYDANNNVSKQISTINGQKRETSYEFDKDNKITKFIFNNGSNFIQYTYDEIARNKEKVLNLGNNVTYKTTTQYLPGINASTSTQVGTISNNGSEIRYTYDKNGNIETIIQSGKTIKYYYNELNEVIREDNGLLNKTIQYTYDSGGNIKSKSEFPYNNGVIYNENNGKFSGENLDIDGGFELNINGIVGRSGAGTTAIVGVNFQPTQKPRSGNKCFYMDGSTGDNFAYINRSIPVTPGKVYNISYYHEEATNGVFNSDSSYIRLSDGSHISFDTPLVNDQSWRKMEKTWVCPEGITSIQLRFGFRTNAYSWMAIDDINISEIQGNNLESDGGFEFGANKVIGKIGNGEANIVGANFQPNQNPRTGNKCFYINGSSGDNYAYLSKTIPVTPGKTYYLSFYHEESTSSSFNSDSSYIKLSDGSHVSFDTPLVNDKTWRKMEKVWTCPAGITSIQLRFGFRSNAYSWMSVDDINIFELNNLYTKGDFEQEGNIIDGRIGAGSTAIVGNNFQPNQKPRSGNKCFYIDGNTGDNYVYINPVIPVVPGKTYNISFYHNEATSGNFNSDSSYIRLSDGSHVYFDTPLVNDQSWRKMEKKWTCPEGITSIQLRFGFRINAFSWMAIDDIQVVDESTYYSSQTINYEYGDSNWKDKLTSYNGKNITYDEIGNPLTYDGYTYTWERGRTLTKIAGNNKTISYKYDGSGIRTEKNVNGVVSKYTLQGDKVVYEEVTNGSNVDKIYYTYDGSSNLVSMNLNSVEYYYVRNLQGDIIGLIDKTGTQVVSYNYDSWGKLISIEGSLKDSVGVKNPYRYRGYRYDNGATRCNMKSIA